jgi:hypothetical protein
MGDPYTEQSASSYNSNPPADDGSESSENQVKWSTIKTKLADPLKTLIDDVDDAVAAAFDKTFGSGAVASTADDYTVGASDQGKQIVVTVAAKTVTTPDAAAVGAPFMFGVFNASAGAITLDGSGSQTINGVATLTLAPGQGMIVFTDGSNWRAYGEVGTFVGKQMGYGQIINGTIAEANATNAVTFALKTLAGADPSAADPVLLAFRSATAGSGLYVYRTVTAALSLTISSGSTLGAPSGVPFKVWLVIFDDGGTLRMGAINCNLGGATPIGIYPLGRFPIASSTAEGGAGASDAAHVFYTGSAVSSKPYLVLGYAGYESGIATAGAWNASPTRLHLQGPHDLLPGDTVQSVYTQNGTLASTTNQYSISATSPTAAGGMVAATAPAITPTSATNLISVAGQAIISSSASNVSATAFIYNGSAAIAVSAGYCIANGAIAPAIPIRYQSIAPSGATTYSMYVTGSTGTTYLNGNGATQWFGSIANTWISVEEIMT